MKKTYITPAVGVIEISTDHVLAASIKTGSGTVNAQNALSNKREQSNHSWSSDHWANNQ